MTRTDLSVLDLDHYAELLRRLCPQAQGFAICSKDGDWISTDDVFEQVARRALPSRPRGADELGRFELDGDGCVYSIELGAAGNESLGTLIVSMGAPTAGGPGADDAQVYDALVPWVVCISNDLRLNTEIESMAGELIERYEELNLVYHTEDQASLFDDNKNALQTLVDNCADYLESNLAVLVLREKGLVLTNVSKKQQLADSDLITKWLCEEIYDGVQEAGESIVINEPSDLADPNRYRLPCKVLACPVLDSLKRVNGVLFMANELMHPNFANSDKNILSVMARKVSKLVQGSYDELTGLVNRKSFEHIARETVEGSRITRCEHTLMHVNLDKLHVVNDTKGNEAGDHVVKSISERIVAKLRDSDVVGRIGGDEFGVLVRNCGLQRGVKIAEKIRASIEAPIEWNGGSLKVSARFGVAGIDGASETVQAVLAAAHVACDLAKEEGGNRVQVYERHDESLCRREHYMQMVAPIHAALREDRFELYGQLIKPLGPEASPHVEILIRMIDENGAPVRPDMFLPAAERYHFMGDIDRWVIKRTLETLADFGVPQADGNAVFAINLSGQSVTASGLQSFISEMLDDLSIPGAMICFEITETAAVANIERAQAFMNDLRRFGCSFALDDFGAGLSSFGYLKTFPVDYLKIDGSLVKGIDKDPVAESMVAAVNQVGHVMGLKTIAEFVENTNIENKLRLIGLDFVQGYGIGRPQPLTELLSGWFERKADTGT